MIAKFNLVNCERKSFWLKKISNLHILSEIIESVSKIWKIFPLVTRIVLEYSYIIVKKEFHKNIWNIFYQSTKNQELNSVNLSIVKETWDLQIEIFGSRTKIFQKSLIYYSQTTVLHIKFNYILFLSHEHVITCFNSKSCI